MHGEYHLIAAVPDACRYLQDPNVPVSTQATSIKLLHSVVEVMFARHADRTTADLYRLQLDRILDVFISKLSVIKHQTPKLLAAGWHHPMPQRRVNHLKCKTCLMMLLLVEVHQMSTLSVVRHLSCMYT